MARLVALWVGRISILKLPEFPGHRKSWKGFWLRRFHGSCGLGSSFGSCFSRWHRSCGFLSSWRQKSFKKRQLLLSVYNYIAPQKKMKSIYDTWIFKTVVYETSEWIFDELWTPLPNVQKVWHGLYDNEVNDPMTWAIFWDHGICVFWKNYILLNGSLIFYFPVWLNSFVL